MSLRPSQADDRIIDAAGPCDGAPPLVLRAVALGCLIAAILGSGPLRDAADALPGGRVGDMMRAGAGAWDHAMSQIGAPRPYAALRTAIRRAEAWDWDWDAP